MPLRHYFPFLCVSFIFKGQRKMNKGSNSKRSYFRCSARKRKPERES